VLALEPDGNVASLDIRRLPVAYHGVNHLLNDFDALSHDERQAACLGLIEAARLQYPDVTGVAIDHIRGHVLVHPGDTPRPPSDRIRVHRCSAP